MLTDDQAMINGMLLSLMDLTEQVEETIKRNEYDSNIKKCEYLLKLHKSLMKSHRIALKIKAIENYGDEYNED